MLKCRKPLARWFACMVVLAAQASFMGAGVSTALAARPSAHFPKSVLHLEPRPFTDFGKLWATHKLIDSSAAFLFEVPEQNSPLVVQELQIGGTSLSFAGALTFGMSPEEAATALGVPLTYVRGRAGNELFLAIPNVKGSALSIRSDALYLQFRRGRLAGWKGDWGTAKPWVGW
jgi:hypothetical protein